MTRIIQILFFKRSINDKMMMMTNLCVHFKFKKWWLIKFYDPSVEDYTQPQWYQFLIHHITFSLARIYDNVNIICGSFRKYWNKPTAFRVNFTRLIYFGHNHSFFTKTWSILFGPIFTYWPYKITFMIHFYI